MAKTLASSSAAGGHLGRHFAERAELRGEPDAEVNERSRCKAYRVRERVPLCKCCGKKLRGTLVETGLWYEAQVFETNVAPERTDTVVGYVRLRMEGDRLRTQCKKSVEDNWVVECMSQRVNAISSRGLENSTIAEV